MKKYIGLFLMCLVCFVSKTYAGNPQRDFKSELEGVLEEQRVAFDPVIVEDTMKLYMANPPIYDIKVAAETYDELAKKNDGYMSIPELFYVCLKSFKEKPVNPWNACRTSFIDPLLLNSEETSFIDDAVLEAYDGHSFDRFCYPPETDVDKLTPNIICTTGRYETIDPVFEKAMITKFRTEGGCTDRQKDGCHRTCYGVCSGNINKKTHKYQVYNEKLERDFQNKTHTFTRADAEDYGYAMYKRNKINLLPDAIRGDVFMALWGTGQPERSIGLLQQVLGVPQTNIVDDTTIRAAADYTGGNLRKKFLKARWKNMKDNGSFSNGWARGFMVYLKNGCHTVPVKPLFRTPETVAGCSK